MVCLWQISSLINAENFVQNCCAVLKILNILVVGLFIAECCKPTLSFVRSCLSAFVQLSTGYTSWTIINVPPNFILYLCQILTDKEVVKYPTTTVSLHYLVKCKSSKITQLEAWNTYMQTRIIWNNFRCGSVILKTENRLSVFRIPLDERWLELYAVLCLAGHWTQSRVECSAGPATFNDTRAWEDHGPTTNTPTVCRGPYWWQGFTVSTYLSVIALSSREDKQRSLRHELEEITDQQLGQSVMDLTDDRDSLWVFTICLSCVLLMSGILCELL